MAYLEELLPEFRKGAKIRCSDWNDDEYICIKNNVVVDENGVYHRDFYDEYLISDEWEFYQEPIDWDYIIKNKCLCWFWDGEKDNNASMGCLGEVYSEKYNSFRSREGTRWNHCIPVRKDEVTFYEDRKDE